MISENNLFLLLLLSQRRVGRGTEAREKPKVEGLGDGGRPKLRLLII